MRLDDAEAFCAHVHEQEGQNTGGQHRQRDAGVHAQAADATDRQAEEDREAGDRAQRGCFGEGHGLRTT
jgi:hypothetical protein